MIQCNNLYSFFDFTHFKDRKKEIFLFVFWFKWKLQGLLSRLSDLYYSRKCSFANRRRLLDTHSKRLQSCFDKSIKDRFFPIKFRHRYLFLSTFCTLSKTYLFFYFSPDLCWLLNSYASQINDKKYSFWYFGKIKNRKFVKLQRNVLNSIDFIH